MPTIVPNLAIAGYRSFGKEPQFFERFAKINIFIGQNNAGKSNILRFLSEVYSLVAGQQGMALDALARHLPDHSPLLLGIGEPIDTTNPTDSALAETHRLVAGFKDPDHQAFVATILGKLMKEKARLDGTELCWTLITLPDRKDTQESWSSAIKVLTDKELQTVWGLLTHMTGGDRNHHWEPEVLQRMPASTVAINVQTIPAIRQIGSKGTTSESFDGSGIIERLARLQNPDVHSQKDRQGFTDITNFLREVIDRPDANIEIPYERDTILIHMDRKVLPIESLGSGIHEVIILAAAATVLTGNVICIEEPELHLNPILQRKLIRYLSQHTSNQYFITTHSAVLMDTAGAETYHVKLVNGSSIVERVTSDRQRSAVCEDLGYHPSDLLQANCIIWVEGPSDRIYINWWLKHIDSSLIEGVHYSVMFYGGRLASHLSNEDLDSTINDFISLRRLNRRGVMIMDSDRDRPRAQLNQTKRRLQDEFDRGPGHAWITDGREIENYIPLQQLESAIQAASPRARPLGAFGKYDNTLKVRSARGKDTHAPKVEVARHIAENFTPDCSVYDLKQRINRLRKFIEESNPTVGPR